MWFLEYIVEHEKDLENFNNLPQVPLDRKIEQFLELTIFIEI
jgi:hypothetical protein